ncbi:permease [uncultured Bifidobacterium sp.]|uniref:permease n=1 Tax=uncultured Bifidobacterium sp. TaxID=165187 RepID=UPI002584A846|nr:permease [uncultured Bifidobacterium sp.]
MRQGAPVRLHRRGHRRAHPQLDPPSRSSRRSSATATPSPWCSPRSWARPCTPFGTLPIAEALYAKGVGLGTLLAFMMSVTVLSIPSLTMLARVVKPRLLATFVGVCLIGMIASGYLFNALQPLFV